MISKSEGGEGGWGVSQGRGGVGWYKRGWGRGGLTFFSDISYDSFLNKNLPTIYK